MNGARHFWLIMRYACDKCGHRIDFYLEDGCEGPRDRQAPVPPVWEAQRARAPKGIKLPTTVPQTAGGRYVLPVPFIAAPCPKCQPHEPRRLNGGVLQHVDWHDEPKVDTLLPPPDAGVFHYPKRWDVDQACGEPVLPDERRV